MLVTAVRVLVEGVCFRDCLMDGVEVSLGDDSEDGLLSGFFETQSMMLGAYEQRFMASAHRVIKCGGARGPLSAFAWGDGEAVLLVHGLGGRGVQLRAFVEPLVRRGFMPVLFDLPGHGSREQVRTDFDECADAIAMVALACGRVAAAITHSLGALWFLVANRHHALCERLVTLGAPASLVAHVERHLTAQRADAPARAALYAGLERRFGAGVWTEYSPDALLCRSIDDLLVVHDREDRVVPFEDALALVKRTRSASLLATSGLGHIGLVANLGVVGRACEFVAGEKH
ncbi:MAG: hypothetical protein RL685_7469 [Pseudomonadota bacterium]|jgi:pimeloyl-ACP methyl ester carboxylesterase